MNGEFFLTGLYVLDNFSAHSIVWQDTIYPTVEHAYQAAHFTTTSPPLALRIASCTSPLKAKELAHCYESMEDPDWLKMKLPIMDQLLRCKAEQHEDVRQALVDSGTVKLVEANPNDTFWGCGPDGEGENWMGRLWMAIRDEIVADQARLDSAT